VRKPGQVEQARARAARGRRRPALGLDAIVERTLRIVDAEGVGAVSMRRVAAEFDTGPASLYAYVPSKEALLQLVLDRILTEIPEPVGDTWQDLLRAMAHDTRAVMQRHNDAAALTFAHIPTGERSLQVIERLLAAMISAGVPPQVATWSLDILSLYIAGDVYEGWQLKQRFDDGSGRDPEEVGMEHYAAIAAEFAAIPAERYPYLVANVGVMMTGSSDERFAFGVDMLIAGFAAQVTPRPSAPPSGTP
jgi:AcrR family transcriptional regulator